MKDQSVCVCVGHMKTEILLNVSEWQERQKSLVSFQGKLPRKANGLSRKETDVSFGMSKQSNGILRSRVRPRFQSSGCA